MKRTVEDVMTRDVATIGRSALYKDVVRLIETTGNSALPVLDEEGCLIGILSEADLLLKEEHPPREPRRMRSRGKRRTDRDKADGRVAWQFMSAPVVTVGPQTSISGAARILHERRIKRLPVVDEAGKLIGIVTRADLLAVFLRPDEDIRDEILQEVIERKLWLSPEEGSMTVRVESGVVQLRGHVDRKSTMDILVGLVAEVDGVVGVDDQIRYKVDDTQLRPPPDPPWGVLPYALRRP